MFFGILSSSVHRGMLNGSVEATGFFALKVGGITAMGP